MGKKRTKATYTEDQRQAALALLRDNGCNYTITSRALNVPGSTLRLWVLRYGVPERDEGERTTIAEAQSHFVSRTLSGVEALAAAAVERALTLVRTEEDLGKVNGTINAITRYAELLRASSDTTQPNPCQSSTLSLIQQTIFNCNGEKS